MGTCLIQFLANRFIYIFQSSWLILGHICNKMFSSSQYAILARYLICLFDKCLIWSLESLGIWLGSCGKLFLTFFWETVVYIFFKVIDLSLVFFLIWHLLYWEEIWYIYWTMFVHYKVTESLVPWTGYCCKLFDIPFGKEFSIYFWKWYIGLWSYLY